jgi:hypothetical protein
MPLLLQKNRETLLDFPQRFENGIVDRGDTKYC